MLGHVREKSSQVFADASIAFSLQAFRESGHGKRKKIKLKERNQTFRLKYAFFKIDFKMQLLVDLNPVLIVLYMVYLNMYTNFSFRIWFLPR